MQIFLLTDRGRRLLGVGEARRLADFLNAPQFAQGGERQAIDRRIGNRLEGFHIGNPLLLDVVGRVVGYRLEAEALPGVFVDRLVVVILQRLEVALHGKLEQRLAILRVLLVDPIDTGQRAAVLIRVVEEVNGRRQRGIANDQFGLIGRWLVPRVLQAVFGQVGGAPGFQLIRHGRQARIDLVGQFVNLARLEFADLLQERPLVSV